MNSIFMREDDIRKLEPLSFPNRGLAGQCYKYEDGVLKVFHRTFSVSGIKHNIRKNFKRESVIIMYPRKKLYVVDRSPFLMGYTCNMAPGFRFDLLRDKIKLGILDVSFDEFLTSYYDIFIKELKKEKVILNDVKFAHIFFDDNFYLVDSDLYYDKPVIMTEKEKNDQNISLFNENINYFIRDFLFLNNFICDFEYKNEDFLDKTLNYIMKVSQNEVNSFGALAEYEFTDAQIKELGKVL